MMVSRMEVGVLTHTDPFVHLYQKEKGTTMNKLINKAIQSVAAITVLAVPTYMVFPPAGIIVGIACVIFISRD